MECRANRTLVVQSRPRPRVNGSACRVRRIQRGRRQRHCRACLRLPTELSLRGPQQQPRKVDPAIFTSLEHGSDIAFCPRRWPRPTIDHSQSVALQTRPDRGVDLTDDDGGTPASGSRARASAFKGFECSNLDLREPEPEIPHGRDVVVTIASDLRVSFAGQSASSPRFGVTVPDDGQIHVATSSISQALVQRLAKTLPSPVEPWEAPSEPAVRLPAHKQCDLGVDLSDDERDDSQASCAEAPDVEGEAPTKVFELFVKSSRRCDRSRKSSSPQKRADVDANCEDTLREYGSFLTGRRVRYDGPRRQSPRHGEGHLVLDDGDTYSGQWAHRVAHGRGRYLYADGASYDGEWWKGSPYGKGLETFPDASRYEGDFFDGVKQGAGVWQSAAGCLYSGDFKDDMMHGEGHFKFVDGRLYTGQWRCGLMTGHGRMEWPPAAHLVSARVGDVYDGQWLNDHAHGFGKYEFADGGFYEGEWFLDSHHGRGVEGWPDGEKYEGEFYEGFKHGVGRWMSGETQEEYTGQFWYDRLDGEGRYSFSDGNIYSGQWTDGYMTGRHEVRTLRIPAALVHEENGLAGSFISCARRVHRACRLQPFFP